MRTTDTMLTESMWKDITAHETCKHATLPSTVQGWGDGYEGLKLAMFEAKIRYEGLVFRFWRPQNLKEHTWFWVR